MSYLLTVSYANEKVAETSYRQLHKAMADNPCKVLLFDNRYPLNKPDFIPNLCKELGFEYYTKGKNVGIHDSFNFLIDQLPEVNAAIFYGGDHFIREKNWHLKVLEVADDPNVYTAAVNNSICKAEIDRHGGHYEDIKGHRCRITHGAITDPPGAYNIPFLRSLGGIVGEHYYYGGQELTRWPHYNDKKYAIVEDIWDDVEMMKDLHDWQYEEYKILYAHRGLGMSFDDFLKTNPKRRGVDNLIKEIFG